MNTQENDNSRTLQSYQDKTQEYIDGTPPLDETTKAWLDAALNYIPTNGRVLEVGSGFGRGAEYVQQKGYSVECSDAVPNFVELLQKKGFKARLLDLLKDDLGAGYDMVLADAVLLHFTPDESATVVKEIYTALNDRGIFALRMKQGKGPVWSEEKIGEPRYFYYWQEGDLKKLLKDSGFEWLEMTKSHAGHNNADWMHIIARKIS
jgi:SAM-dependent methyltransferase